MRAKGRYAEGSGPARALLGMRLGACGMIVGMRLAPGNLLPLEDPGLLDLGWQGPGWSWTRLRRWQTRCGKRT